MPKVGRRLLAAWASSLSTTPRPYGNEPEPLWLTLLPGARKRASCSASDEYSGRRPRERFWKRGPLSTHAAANSADPARTTPTMTRTVVTWPSMPARPPRWRDMAASARGHWDRLRELGGHVRGRAGGAGAHREVCDEAGSGGRGVAPLQTWHWTECRGPASTVVLDRLRCRRCRCPSGHASKFRLSHRAHRITVMLWPPRRPAREAPVGGPRTAAER
jgi:hypothetical protein